MRRHGEDLIEGRLRAPDKTARRNEERQEAKASRGELTGQLDELRDRVQIHREKNIELETAVRLLTEKNGGLEAELTAAQSEASDLSQALQQEKQRAEALRRDFDAYKDKHKISGDQGELKADVDALQARLKKGGAE